MSAVSTNDKATVLTLKKRLSEPDRDLMAIVDSLSSINMDKQLLKETMIELHNPEVPWNRTGVDHLVFLSLLEWLTSYVLHNSALDPAS
ncbi:hypothetical protein FOZ62_005812 [Perkinsus olseni]|uniref:Uncharacterized protein n=1 Tax=Perkinsus olseni TaxID=32597 RepID=A0A7J6S4Z2_PEROL|nr:hypothetical protein FOZ62_005812 [Perkinsus olseni]